MKTEYNHITNYFPPPGYYCPEGQTVRNPSPYECDPGYYCTVGSSIQTICQSGQYQDEAGQSSCKDCPVGFYCDNSLGPITTPSNYPCPEGMYYCFILFLSFVFTLEYLIWCFLFVFLFLLFVCSFLLFIKTFFIINYHYYFV